MCRVIIPGTVLLLCAASSTLAKELSDAEIKARDFSYRSATFGMRLPDFEAQFDVGMPFSVEPLEDSISYLIPHTNTRSVYLTFKHRQINSISVIVLRSEVARVGKVAVERKVLDTFGKPHEKLNGSYVWRFPNVSRTVAYVPNDDGSVSIMVMVDGQEKNKATDGSIVEFEF